MITCPSCAHSNPDGAVNCEACFTPLPIVKNIQCPNCHSTMLSDAQFCGHCGFNLSESKSISPQLAIANSMSNSLPNEMTEDNTMGTSSLENLSSEIANIPNVAPNNFAPNNFAQNNSVENNLPEIQELAEVALYPEPDLTPIPQPESANASTQLQQFAASLLHVQTNLNIEIPAHLPVVHIGKPNMVIPPDIDVSGFPDSDIVSRIHADIRAEGGSFYFEDTGSSNGTYINNLPLPAGNRHKLRAGDRISLGKGDKVSFVFQVIS